MGDGWVLIRRVGRTQSRDNSEQLVADSLRKSREETAKGPRGVDVVGCYSLLLLVMLDEAQQLFTGMDAGFGVDAPRVGANCFRRNVELLSDVFRASSTG